MKIKIFFILFFLSFFKEEIHSQLFIGSDQVFPALSRGEAAWSDFDLDHDLDVFLTGRGEGGEMISLLFRNDEGIFTDYGPAFIPVEESSASWGDYDKDGDQDLLLAGNSAYGDICLIYKNEDGVIVPHDAGISPIQQGVVQWIDYDADNDLDIFISGNWITKIYRNDEGLFSDISADFGFFNSSAATFGDFDNDGDMDLLIIGDSGAGAVSKVFLNSDGVFEDSGIVLQGLMAGTADWIDYDLDGDLDAAISGYDDALESQFILYKNSAASFGRVYAGISGFAIGSCDWADYDHDGDPDLIMTGKASGCGAYVSGIYRNEGNDFFLKIQENIPVATRSSINWIDFDNDEDYDYLVSGLDVNDSPFTTLFINSEGTNSFTANTAPVCPQTLNSEIMGNHVELSWTEGLDETTPVNALTYNLRMGTLPGLDDIIPSMANNNSGLKLLPGSGNVGQNRSWNISNLEPGTYYWSVQTVDGGFEGSSFAEEQSFDILQTGLDTEIDTDIYLVVFPNPAKDWIRVQIDKPINRLEFEIFDLSGKKWLAGFLDDTMIIDLKELRPAFYILKINAGLNPRSFMVSKVF